MRATLQILTSSIIPFNRSLASLPLAPILSDPAEGEEAMGPTAAVPSSMPFTYNFTLPVLLKVADMWYHVLGAMVVPPVTYAPPKEQPLVTPAIILLAFVIRSK